MKNEQKRFPNEMIQTAVPEGQTFRGDMDFPLTRPGFLDLRTREDDKRVLKNPHKGWFWHYIDNGARALAYRDHNLSDDFVCAFPGLNHLYLRFDWADVEKEEGVYDFSYLDGIMDHYGKLGFTFSLRVCTYESAKEMEFATPRYVFEKGARCFTQPESALQPDYADPYFLERVEALLKVMGEKYNSDPRVELVDVGTYGTWGEGHTCEGDGVIYPWEVVKKHIDLHIKYFPDKYVIANDDLIAGRMAHGREEMQEVLDYCEARGLGLQDDSICCDGYATDMAYDTMRAPWAFQKLAKNAPSVIEFAHYTYIRPNFDVYYRNGYTIIEALKNSKATFAGFHGHPDTWLEREFYLAEYCANRLGYWMFVPYAVVPELTASAHNNVRFFIENRGWAKPYYDMPLFVKLKGENGEFVRKLDANLKSLDSGEKQEFSCNLDLRDVPAGKYQLLLGAECDGRPVHFGVKEEFEDGFFAKICETTVC